MRARLHPLAASRLAHGAIVMAAAFTVSIGTLNNGLVFDDATLLGVNAAYLSGEQPLSDVFSSPYWGSAGGTEVNALYRPLTIASLALNAGVGGDTVAALHGGNILLHALNALLVYFLVRALFRRGALALLAALLFAVHPVATEPVAAVAGRADLLSTAFFLSACLLVLDASRQRGLRLVTGALASAMMTLMGALSKENIFAAPLLVLVLLAADRLRGRKANEISPGSTTTAGILLGSQALALLLALLQRAGILGYLYRGTPPGMDTASYLAFVNNPLQFVGTLERAAASARIALKGIGLLAFPGNLSADYSYNQIAVSTGSVGIDWLIAIGCLALLMGLIAWSATRHPVVLFATGWFAGSYLLVSNLLFPIGTVFGERLLYLPSIGFALLISEGITRLAGRGPKRRVMAVSLSMVVLSLYGARFVTRCRDWVDDDHLFAAAVIASPDSAKAHSNYGFTLQRAGRQDDAVEAYRRAVEIAPRLTGARLSLAYLLNMQGHHQEAAGEYRAVIKEDDGIPAAWSGLGMAQAAGERLEEAEDSFRRSLELSRAGDAEALRGLAEVMQRTDREQEALALLEDADAQGARDLGPAIARAHYLLGIRLLREDRREDFIAEMRRAVLIDPLHGPAHYNLALDAVMRQEMGVAREHAEAGLQAGYQFPPGFLEAVGLAEQATE